MDNLLSNDVDAIVIRPATEFHVDAIGELWVKLVAYHRGLDDKLPESAKDGGKLYARRILDRLEDTHARAFVAERDGLVIGYALGVIIDLVPEMFAQETGGFLADIFVEESERGHGIGRKLVDAMSEWFHSRGIAHMELYVASRNESGRAFWEAVGGREIMRRIRIEL
ncbi:MAG: GNAT family N-acetyltransferase [Chitinophagaceae bacterium]|nr:GNAT family N-acetyltransferase [Anaerolineae bacterium]